MNNDCLCGFTDEIKYPTILSTTDEYKVDYVCLNCSIANNIKYTSNLQKIRARIKIGANIYNEGSTSRQVLDYIAEYGYTTSKKVAIKTHKQRSNVCNVLKSMEDLGILRSIKSAEDNKTKAYFMTNPKIYYDIVLKEPEQ